MKRLIPLLLATLIAAPSTLFGQAPSKVLQPDNAMIQKVAARVAPTGTIYFQQGLNVPPQSFLTNNKTHLGLTDADEMKLSHEQTDPNGGTVHRFQQYHDGIPVEGGEYVIHVRNGALAKLRGRVAEGLNIEISRAMPEEFAREIAVNALGRQNAVEKTARLDPMQESPRPKGKKVIVLDQAADDGSYVLAYVFRLHTPDSIGGIHVYIDAQTGNVLKKISPPTSNAAVGTVFTQYNGTRSFATRKRGWPNNDHVLQDHTRGEITTKNNPWIWGLGSQVTDGDNLWSHNEASAHWAVQKAHDYFKDAHFRNGVDNGNEEIRVYAKADNISYEAFSNYSVICLSAEYTTLDVAGHEFTHGVIHHTTGLRYENESGALNESFADIFGTMVEREFRGGLSFDWWMGGEATAVRNLQNPLIFSQPDTYQDPPWFNISGCVPDCTSSGNDCCGVHTNSGVQNRWFSLLVDGGFHNNIVVNGIGPIAARRIAYRNMTSELFSSAGYADAREGAIDAAETLYGACSNEVEQVTNAWAAVGVGAPFGNCVPPLGASITGPFQGQTWTNYLWQASASGGVAPFTYQWRVDGILVGTSSSLTRSFSIDGNYQIQLTVIDGAGQVQTAWLYFAVGDCEDDELCIVPI